MDGGSSNVVVSGIGSEEDTGGVGEDDSEEDTGGVGKDDSGDGSGVTIGSEAGTGLAQAKEKIRLAAISSTLICLKALIIINHLIPPHPTLLAYPQSCQTLHII